MNLSLVQAFSLLILALFPGVSALAQESCPPVTISVSESICQGDSIYLEGAYQTTSGLYTDSLLTSQGCDSVVNTTLQVLSNSVQQQIVKICPDDSVVVGSQVYTQPGNYLDSLPAYNGCDSIVYTSLTHILPVVGQDAIILCDGDSAFLQGRWRKNSGVYRDTLTSIATGCDSILFTSVTAITLLDSVVNKNNTLQSLQTNVNYQWIECVGDTIVPGATGAFFKPSVSGSYKVALSLGGCRDTSDCVSVGFTSIDEYRQVDHSFDFFPNPANEVVTLQFRGEMNREKTILLISPLGQEIGRWYSRQDSMELPLLNYPAGLYLIGVDGKFQSLVIR